MGRDERGGAFVRVAYRAQYCRPFLSFYGIWTGDPASPSTAYPLS